MGVYGQGLAALSPVQGQMQTAYTPDPTALQTALGWTSVLGGILRDDNNTQSSDIRLKTDIKLTGQSSTGVNIYSFKYKGDDKTYQGVMAQEVPWASIKGIDGYYLVDYSKVDVAFKRLQ